VKEHPRETTTPPNNEEAERAVIGSILLDPKHLEAASAVVSPGDFYGEARRVLFGRLVAMRKAGLAVDTLLLCDHLKAHGEWETSSGKERTGSRVSAVELAECAHAVPVAAHAVHYAEIVAEASFRRRLIRAAEILAARAYDPSVGVTELRKAAAGLLRKIAGPENPKEAPCSTVPGEGLPKPPAISTATGSGRKR
jgi:replicative DNA helicase